MGRFADRFYGPPPARDDPPLVHLRYTRAVSLKMGLPLLPLMILAVLGLDETWIWVVAAVWFVGWAGNLVYMSLRIRRGGASLL